MTSPFRDFVPHPYNRGLFPRPGRERSPRVNRCVRAKRTLDSASYALKQSHRSYQEGAPRMDTASRVLPSYLRTAEVAQMLHVSPKTITRWAKEGRLPHSRTLGGHRRYAA